MLASAALGPVAVAAVVYGKTQEHRGGAFQYDTALHAQNQNSLLHYFMTKQYSWQIGLERKAEAVANV